MEAMIDGTATEANIDISKAGLGIQPAFHPPVPTQSSMTPTPKPTATSSATPWQRLTYLDENDTNQKVKTLADAQRLIDEEALRPETLGACHLSSSDLPACVMKIVSCIGCPVEWRVAFLRSVEKRNGRLGASGGYYRRDRRSGTIVSQQPRHII